ncbi:MAG: MFS transporter [Armatimonadota bacterium]
MRKHPLLWLIITAIPVSLVGTMAWFGVFTFVNGYLVKQLGYSNADWTASTLWFVGGVIGWQVLCTEISARIGRRATVTLAMAMVALGYLGLMCTSNPLLINGLLVLMGFIVAATPAAWLPLVIEVEHERPGRALAAVQLTAAAWSSIALVSGGYLVTALGYRNTFLTFIVASLLCAAAFHWCARTFREEHHAQVISLRCVSKADLRSLLAGPFLIVLLLGVCMEPFNYHSVNQLFPNIARDIHAFNEQHISLVVALGRLPAILSLFVLAYFIDRINPLRVYGTGLMLAGISVVGFGLAPTAGWLVAAYFAYYLSHGSVWGSNTASVNAVTPNRLRDAAFAIMSIISLSFVLVVGVIHNRLLSAGVTLPHVFLWCGLIAAVAGVTLLAYSFSAHAGQRSARTPGTTVTEPPASVA